jgi:hypothetical protein
MIASFLLLSGTANAAAATRFAAPGGTAPASSECKRQEPCSLYSAASDSAPNSALQAGDEVVVLPGTYSVPAGDLGPSSTLAFLRGIQVHGLAGAPHPLIVVAGGTNRLLQINPEDVVSDLEVESGSRLALFIVGGVVDEVVVRDPANESVACRQNGGVLLDSACLDSGLRGRALEGNATPAGVSLKLRNVTAIATGQDSLGLHFAAGGGDQLSVDAKAVIAEGERKDIEAIGGGAGSNVTVDLENSDFDSREVRVENGAAASITAPGSGANIIEPPQFAGDGYHELPGSPTVDRGVVDASSGTTDIDGEARTIGIAPDIGADELSRDPVDSSLSCVPSAVEIREASTCTITVKDAIKALSQPEGEVHFESDHDGDFSPASASCELEGISADEASCHVTYTPTAAREHLITAIYQGDDNHISGSALTRVTVAPHLSATSLHCTPSAVIAGKVSTCVAVVVDPKADPIQPEGEVHFSSDHRGAFTPGSASCKLEGISADEASCHIAYKPAEAGEHLITAEYRGDDNHNSGSAQTQVTAAPRPPSAVSFHCAPTAVIVGEASTCAVAVFNLDPGDPDQPGGEVHFSRDHKAAFTPASATCELEGISPGEAGCHVTYTPTERGQHLITAEYRGDDNHDSGSAPTQVTVTARPSATAVLCAPARVQAGGTSTCTVSVKDTQANSIQPEGEVHFESDHRGDFNPATAKCKLEGVSADEASCHLTYTPTENGTHKITASFPEDQSHDSSNGSAQVTVAPHPSATTVLCTPDDVVAGEASTCVVFVEDADQANSIQPEGEVHFESDHRGDFNPATAKCKLEGVSADEASCHLTYTPTENGTHKITASFPEDQSHDSSESSAQVKAAPHPSTTTVACTPASLALGSGATTCTTTVADPAPNPKAPGGKVEFAGDGHGAFGNGGACTLANAQGGKASCQILYTPSAAGSAHELTAAYGGDLAHEKSQGQARLEVIEAPKVPKIPIADPNTKLTKKPRKKTARRRARFAFVSDQAGSTFQCKLDKKPFRPCRSPFKKKVKPGRHTFKVRAIDPQGLSDPTPALYKWRVRRVRH